MKQYLELLKYIQVNGIEKETRNGKTKSIFGYQMRFDLAEGFPLLTTKKLHIKSIFCELLWFLRGETNIKYLHDNQVSIWDEWADDEGNLGKIYGYQWRSFNGKCDQIKQLITEIKQNPHSRRLIVTSWNPCDLPDMALPACHCFFQCYVADNKLHLQLYQRSCDVFLGLPFNIASYSLLLHLLAKECNLEAGTFVWTGGDVHLYADHYQQAEVQLKREPRPLPSLQILRGCAIFEYNWEDFAVNGYNPHSSIKAPVNV